MASPALAFLFAQRVVVGVGDLSVSNNPSLTLSTYALGSCVGIAVYDSVGKIGGLLHIMLPAASIAPEKAASQPGMFADTGLPLLFRSLRGLRADPGRLRIFIAGGASVLSGPDTFKIGDRNLSATMDFMAKHGLPVRYSVTGGTTNRTLHLDIGSGSVLLKTPDGTDSYSLVA